MLRKNENVSGIWHAHMCRKEDIFRQRRLNHSGVGGGNPFKRVYPARAYSLLNLSCACYIMYEDMLTQCFKSSLHYIQYSFIQFVRGGITKKIEGNFQGWGEGI